VGKSGVKWVWAKNIFTYKSRKKFLFNIHSCVNTIYKLYYIAMGLNYIIDFSKFSPEELQAWGKALCERDNKQTGQNLEFTEQDLSKVNHGFPFEPEQATKWEQKTKDSGEIN